MFIKRKNLYKVVICVILIFSSLIPAKVRVRANTLPTLYTRVNGDNPTYYEEYYVDTWLKTEGLANNGSKEVVSDYTIDLTNAVKIKFVYSESAAGHCKLDNSYGTIVREMTLNGVKNLTGSMEYDLRLADKWGNTLVKTTQAYRNAKACTNCGYTCNYVMSIMYIRIEKMKPVVTTNPQNVYVQAGKSATFKAAGTYARGYKWQREVNGTYVDINDGPSEDGTIYAGTDSQTLTISNISGELNNSNIRCALLTSGSLRTYTQGASLGVSVPATPTPTPTPEPTIVPTPTVVPTPEPTVVPTITPTPIVDVTPTITPEPTIVPTITPTPIIKEPVQTEPTRIPSNDNDIHPSTSSSSYIKNFTDDNKVEESSTMKSSSNKPKVDISGDTKSILNDERISDEKIADDDFMMGIGHTNKGTENGVKKKNTYEKMSDTEGDEKGSYINRSSTAKTIVKDGVLYIVDDDEESGDDIENDASKKEDEEYELENAYSENDLMVGANNQTLNAKKTYPFWVYILIIVAFLLGLLLLLLILFFGVIVLGECEEHDDVFDLCRISFLYRNDGKWCVNISEVFDENAVAKLYMGILFAIIFKEFDLTIKSKGIYEGDMIEQIEQGMLARRKKVRRHV